MADEQKQHVWVRAGSGPDVFCANCMARQDYHRVPEICVGWNNPHRVYLRPDSPDP